MSPARALPVAVSSAGSAVGHVEPMWKRRRTFTAATYRIGVLNFEFRRFPVLSSELEIGSSIKN